MLWSIFVVVNDSFYQKQSGFRPNHSKPDTALTELIDTWLSEININKLYGTLFIDFDKAFDVINHDLLAKAFDVINHDLLLRKLTLYGPSANTLSLVSTPSSTAASKRFSWKIIWPGAPIFVTSAKITEKKERKKKSTNQQWFSIFLTFMPEKHFSKRTFSQV